MKHAMWTVRRVTRESPVSFDDGSAFSVSPSDFGRERRKYWICWRRLIPWRNAIRKVPRNCGGVEQGCEQLPCWGRSEQADLSRDYIVQADGWCFWGWPSCLHCVTARVGGLCRMRVSYKTKGRVIDRSSTGEDRTRQGGAMIYNLCVLPRKGAVTSRHLTSIGDHPRTWTPWRIVVLADPCLGMLLARFRGLVGRRSLLERLHLRGSSLASRFRRGWWRRVALRRVLRVRVRLSLRQRGTGAETISYDRPRPT
jgi:hypothetical protein